MTEHAGTIDILIITTGGRRIGIDRSEIGKVIPDFKAEHRDRALLEEFRSRGQVYRLEGLTGGTGTPDPTAALIITAGPRAERLVTFSGAISETTISLADILPLPEYACQKQDPFIFWGVVEEERTVKMNTLMLVTFQFLPEKGSS